MAFSENVSPLVFTETKLQEVDRHFACQPFVLCLRSWLTDTGLSSHQNYFSVDLQRYTIAIVIAIHRCCSNRCLPLFVLRRQSQFSHSSMSCFNGSLYLSATQWRFRYFPHMRLHGSTNISSCVVLVFTYVHWQCEQYQWYQRHWWSQC